METLFGGQLSEEALDDMEEMQDLLDEIAKLKLQDAQSGKSNNKEKLKELRESFKKLAMEVFKEMYGFYNTETGPSGLVGGLLGDQPLSAQEKRLLEK